MFTTGMITFEYVTNDMTETMHVALPLAGTTLCGQKLTTVDENNQPNWTLGDETAAGQAATCSRCKSLAWRKASA